MEKKENRLTMEMAKSVFDEIIKEAKESEAREKGSGIKIAKEFARSLMDYAIMQKERRKLFDQYQKKQLVVVLGHPGSGKTTFATDFVKNKSKLEKKILFCSLETKQTELEESIYLIIDPSPQNILSILNKARDLQKEQGLDYLVIDSLEVISQSPKISREKMLDMLKQSAVEGDFGVVITSHLPKKSTPETAEWVSSADFLAILESPIKGDNNR